LLVIGVLLTQLPYIIDEAHIPPLWIMTALGALAGTQAFVATPATARAPVIICPTICFTFAVLLCWGLGPAILAQSLAVAVVSWRLRRPLPEAVEGLAQYTVSFAAAQLVLWWGHPDPLHHHAASQVASDALTVLGAVAAWLLVYTGFALVVARLRGADY